MPGNTGGGKRWLRRESGEAEEFYRELRNNGVSVTRITARSACPGALPCFSGARDRPRANASRSRARSDCVIAPKTSRKAFAFAAPPVSGLLYPPRSHQRLRSPGSNPMGSFCCEIFLLAIVTAVLLFFTAYTAPVRRPAFSSHQGFPRLTRDLIGTHCF